MDKVFRACETYRARFGLVKGPDAVFLNRKEINREEIMEDPQIDKLVGDMTIDDTITVQETKEGMILRLQKDDDFVEFFFGSTSLK